MSGEFVFLADAGVLTECLTGASFPVAQDMDYIALERAYASSGVSGGQPLLVSFDGHFARRPKMDGAGDSEAIFVDKLGRSWPKQRCSPTHPAGGNSITDAWLGQWNGPEGIYLVLSRDDDKYVIKIQSLDGIETYEGVAAGDRIQFLRDGKTESIHAGSGKETGMKWLMDKKDCLIIQANEGFCRN